MTQIDARNISWDLGRDITHELLIENLGGYEKAKSKFRDNGSLHAERLKKALLEYRRQHNIFEVGDKVVYRNLPHERLFSVRYVGDDEIVVYELWDEMGAKTFTENYPYSDIDHANDAEIEAGKRLEVNNGST